MGKRTAQAVNEIFLAWIGRRFDFRTCNVPAGAVPSVRRDRGHVRRYYGKKINEDCCSDSKKQKNPPLVSGKFFVSSLFLSNTKNTSCFGMGCHLCHFPHKKDNGCVLQSVSLFGGGNSNWSRLPAGAFSVGLFRCRLFPEEGSPVFVLPAFSRFIMLYSHCLQRLLPALGV